MAHYDFNKDLKDGQDAENEVKELLKNHFKVGDDDIESSSSKGFDIKIISQNLTFEVKNDLMAEKTGNIAIEYECRGKPSGLAVTTADYWVYKYKNRGSNIDKFGKIEIRKLKEFLRQNWGTSNYRYRIVTGGDAGSNTKMILIPTTEFETWLTQLNNNA